MKILVLLSVTFGLFWPRSACLCVWNGVLEIEIFRSE